VNGALSVRSPVPVVLRELPVRIDREEVLRFQGYKKGIDVPTADVLALFEEALDLGQRRHELALLGTGAGSHRAILDEYNLDLIDRLMSIVGTSALVSYSLYTFLSEGLPPNNLMMLTIPFALYTLFRLLYLIHVRHEGGAPEEILLRDRPLQVTLALWAVVIFLALYVFS
jgi:hypothetical protein